LGRTGQRGSQVVDVYFPKDRATNRRKNFCFVTFATQQASRNCVFLVCFALRLAGGGCRQGNCVRDAVSVFQVCRVCFGLTLHAGGVWPPEPRPTARVCRDGRGTGG
jgi:hypothetical protein